MLAIFESHPIQYRAPVYRELQRLVPGRFHVFYATDVSLRGNHDSGFGVTVAWDEPLLEGYPHSVLNLERGKPLNGFRSLHGRGLSCVFDTLRPKAILQTQFLYEYDFVALLQAWLRDIPVWIRQETQDEAVHRSPGKSFFRSVAYRWIYSFVDTGFYIGNLNRQHLLRHGITESKLICAHYCTADRFRDLTIEERLKLRARCRVQLGLNEDRIVVGFFGKLIPKKNPELLLKAAVKLPPEIARRITLLFVGSGELESKLRQQAAMPNQMGVRTIFAGFVNQSAIRDYYAATDIVILSSRREGETWGLVINEGLQAGCSIIVSNATGCHQEFGKWDRVRVIGEEDDQGLASAITDLHELPVNPTWASELMKDYSVEEAARAIATQIERKLG
jgi:glycosyltransferase involved in cell wall biosynthesis